MKDAIRKKDKLPVLYTVIFVLLFCFLFAQLTSVFTIHVYAQEQEIYDDFDSIQNDSIQALFLGSSPYIRSISPLIIWKKTGISTCLRSCSGMSAQVQYDMLVDTLKTQSPDVVFLDMQKLVNGYEIDAFEMYLRLYMDTKKVSLSKYNLSKYIAQNSKTQSAVSFMLPLLNYHDRWQELSHLDFYGEFPDEQSRGHFSAWNIIDCSDIDYAYNKPKNLSQIDYDEEEYKFYLKSVELCKSNNIRVVVLSLPLSSAVFPELDAYLGGIDKFAAENGIVHLNTNVLKEKIGIDNVYDWNDFSHLNEWGAIKMSDFLGEYLLDNYEFHDRLELDDSISKQWENDYENFYRNYKTFIPEAFGYNGDRVNSLAWDDVDETTDQLDYIKIEKGFKDQKIKFHREDVTDIVKNNGASYGQKYYFQHGYAEVYHFEENSDSFFDLKVNNKMILDETESKFVIVFSNYAIYVDGIGDQMDIQKTVKVIEDAIRP